VIITHLTKRENSTVQKKQRAGNNSLAVAFGFFLSVEIHLFALKVFRLLARFWLVLKDERGKTKKKKNQIEEINRI